MNKIKEYEAYLTSGEKTEYFRPGQKYIIKNIIVKKYRTLIVFENIPGEHNACMFTYSVPEDSPLIKNEFLKQHS